MSTDADEVKVVATLNADATGRPIELDTWKVDFSPLAGFLQSSTSSWLLDDEETTVQLQRGCGADVVAFETAMQ